MYLICCFYYFFYLLFLKIISCFCISFFFSLFHIFYFISCYFILFMTSCSTYSGTVGGGMHLNIGVAIYQTAHRRRTVATHCTWIRKLRYIRICAAVWAWQQQCPVRSCHVFLFAVGEAPTYLAAIFQLWEVAAEEKSACSFNNSLLTSAWVHSPNRPLGFCECRRRSAIVSSRLSAPSWLSSFNSLRSYPGLN